MAQLSWIARERTRQRDAAWSGIDPDTYAFATVMYEHRRLLSPDLAASCAWLQTCREAGLPTDLDVDFDEPKMAAHLEDRLRASMYAADKPKLAHISALRSALKIYRLALDEGVRRRPVPPVAIPRKIRYDTPTEQIQALLPAADQEKLARAEKIIDTLAQFQWEGRGSEPVKRNGRRHQPTISVATAEGYRTAFKSFLQHAYAEGWEPFDLGHLLTAERICNFAFYGSRVDGAERADGTPDRFVDSLLAWIRRAREYPEPVVLLSAEQQQAVEAEVERERALRPFHRARPARESNAGKYKSLPTLAQVQDAIPALEGQIARANMLRKRNAITKYQHWRIVRDATLAITAMLQMARVDTLATLSLAQLQRDPRTRKVVTYGGSAIIAGIVRAKSRGPDYPFADEYKVAAVTLRYIRALLELEGRSLEQPLRPGDRPVKLSAENGDRWGGTKLPSGQLDVVPLFRRKPGDVKGLAYGSIHNILERQLTFLHFGSTNPHTFRAAGAIWWTFLRAMPEEHVMELGRWTSPKSLRACYARVSTADRLRLWATYMPADGADLTDGFAERARAASDLIIALTRSLGEPAQNADQDRELALAFERLMRARTAERGERYTPVRPDPFQEGEVDLIESALRQAGRGGISAVLGRLLFPEERLLAHAQADANGAPSPKLLALRTTLAAPKRMPPVSGGGL